MVDLVVLRYVEALFAEKSLNKILLDLEKLSLAYEDEKFKEIISSYEVKKSEKVELLNTLTSNKAVKNLVRLLAEKNRLDILPQIYTELNKKINISKNIYTGVVYSKDKLSPKEIKELEKKFSKKFDINLSLVNKNGQYNGIKVEIEDLGVEIGLGLDLVQSQLKDFVLKAV